MFKLLQEHLQKKVALSDEEFNHITSFFIPKKIRKGHFLSQEGEMSKSLTFVVKGCLRSYTIDDKGEEHVVQFAIEGWWIADLNSFLTGEPAIYNIDALEDSEVLMLDKQSRDELLEFSPKFERFVRLLLEKNLIATHKRVACTLTASAEQRYLSFIAAYPSLTQRIPQHQIASYLGIAPESLSRIRKHLAEKG